MFVITRKKILVVLSLAMVVLMLMPGSFSSASDRFKADHPLMPPSPQFSGHRGGIILLFGEVTLEKIFNR